MRWRIFINEKQTGTCLHALHNSCGLGGAAACVRGRKAVGIFLVGKVINEHGDIHILNKTSILRAQLHCCLVRNDIFSSVTGDVVVHPGFQGVQQGGFSVVAAAYDQGDAHWNAHACDLSFVRKI